MDQLRIDDRIVWTDRNDTRWTGWFRGYWWGFADVVLDALQEHGKPTPGVRLKVSADHVTRLSD